MKTNLLTIMFCMVAIAIQAQETPETVVVRVLETWVPAQMEFKSIPASILITHSDETVETIELESKGLKNFVANTQKIQKTLDRFMTDEYELVNSNVGVSGFLNNYMWVFRKVK